VKVISNALLIAGQVREIDCVGGCGKRVIPPSSPFGQAARCPNGEYYETIGQANLALPLYFLLLHHDPTVRSKTCNLLGNLCRHSAYFYNVHLACAGGTRRLLTYVWWRRRRRRNRC
jgi:fused-like protein